ncbi:diguanylate cyclase [Pseudomonas sp. FW305-130]|nr:diguanylate cyclase [Pseudomonas sp. GW460-5]PNB60305.1 diguanylate cyclase [Pseudomonas sp. FW305-130]
MGAGKPANTGEAGAIHRVVFCAGTPAPTEDRTRLETCI